MPILNPTWPQLGPNLPPTWPQLGANLALLAPSLAPHGFLGCHISPQVAQFFKISLKFGQSHPNFNKIHKIWILLLHLTLKVAQNYLIVLHRLLKFLPKLPASRGGLGAAHVNCILGWNMKFYDWFLKISKNRCMAAPRGFAPCKFHEVNLLALNDFRRL